MRPASNKTKKKNYHKRNRSLQTSSARNAVFTFLSVMFFSCLDQIELEIPKGFKESVVIDGKIVLGEPSVFILQVGQLFSFTSDSRGRINAKDAILTDEDGNQMAISQRGTGLYYYEFKPDDPVKILPGKSYKLNIGTFDGREFESTFEPITPVPIIEEIRAEKIEKSVFVDDATTRTDTFIRYSIDTDLHADGSSEKSYLRWEVMRVAKITDAPLTSDITPKLCYVSSNLDVLDNKIFDGPGQTSNRLDNHILVDEDIGPFYGEGLYLTVVQESLSESAFRYWESVKLVSEQEGDLFGSPPGKIKSNFRNLNDEEDEAFGFFYLTRHDTARIFISPEFAGNPPVRCQPPTPQNDDGSCADPLCCDCLIQENSTTTKPHYWVE